MQVTATFFGFSPTHHNIWLNLKRKNRPAQFADRLDTYLFPLMYGCPDAFGASARPMKPVSAMIVRT